MKLKTRNLFFILAAIGGILALVYGVLMEPSESMPEQPHLAFIFTCMTSIMTVVGLIYFLMEKLGRPISEKWGKWHFVITLIAVVCGIICTVTAYDGVENAEWTNIPGFLSIKLYVLSVAVFLVALAMAIFTKPANGK
ncbi:MAG TPA: hypothetical protein VE933_03005 [Chitinophagaceae bacterium]|nr:hypothetical protein [Chitinophagaceae bacterium]